MQVSYSLTTAEPATGTSACWTWIQEMGGREGRDPVWARCAGLVWTSRQHAATTRADQVEGGVDRLADAVHAIEQIHQARVQDMGAIAQAFSSAYRLFDVPRPGEGERFNRPASLLAAFLTSRALWWMRQPDTSPALGDLTLVRDLLGRGLSLGPHALPYLSALQAEAQHRAGLGAASIVTGRQLDAFMLDLRSGSRRRGAADPGRAGTDHVLARKLKRAQRQWLRAAWRAHGRHPPTQPQQPGGPASGRR